MEDSEMKGKMRKNTSSTIFKKRFFFLALILCSLNAFADDEDPCDGLLAVVNRPSVSDSACVVPTKKIVLESGYEYQKLFPRGVSQNFPQSELRIGLVPKYEISLLLPNYIHQTLSPRAGFTATAIKLKHQFVTTPKSVFSLEGILITPSGSYAFGNQALGGTLNGIYAYDITKAFNMTFMLGVSNLTQSRSQGGKRYSTINPDIVFTYQPKETINLYAEVYGQSKTNPNQGSGFNIDTGVIYLLSKNLTFDVEYAHRISGLLGFDQYVGTGFAIQF